MYFQVLKGVGLEVEGEPGLAVLMSLAQHWLCQRAHVTSRELLGLDTVPILPPGWTRGERMRVHVSPLASCQVLGLPGCCSSPGPDLGLKQRAANKRALLGPGRLQSPSMCSESAALFALHFHAAKNTSAPYVRLQVPCRRLI